MHRDLHVLTGTFFLIVGPSGVGKDTLINGARQALGAGQQYVFATRCITRPADAGGEEHVALTEEAFLQREQEGGFLLTWRAHGLHYGLPASLLQDLQEGRNVVANGSRTVIAALAKRVPRLFVISIVADRAAQAARIAERGREVGDAITHRLDRSVSLSIPSGIEFAEIENSGTREEGIECFVQALDDATRRLRIRPYPIDTWHQHIAYLPPDSIVNAYSYLGPERVDLIGVDHHAERSIRANVHISEAAPELAPDEIGLSPKAFEALALPAGARVRIARTPAPSSRAALRAKLNGKRLDEADYQMLLRDMVEGRYQDSEIAAFLVACANRLDDEEVVALARVRTSFTERMHWPQEIVVDKHSMGGIPGSRITMIVIPIVAAHGLAIPKTSSRAITSPAGTADTMETIARVDLSAEEVQQTVMRTGGCIAWNGRLNHSTLDDVMNRITQPLGLNSNRWSVASILSKKLTAGSTHVIIDIPCGPEAKLRDPGDAKQLAVLFETIGQGLGLVVEAHVTDGSAPIGNGIGPALEVRDVERVLGNSPDAPRDLREKALFFASHILAWDPAIGTVEAGRARAEALLASGQALERLHMIAAAQGSHPPIAPAALKHTVRTPHAGRVSSVHVAQISEIARRAGAPLDKAAGIDLLCHPGDLLEANSPLYHIHSSSTSDLKNAISSAQTDCGISFAPY